MKAVDTEKLWSEYHKKPTAEIREQLILAYAQLVKLVAGRLSMYLGHNVEFEDLVSYGIFGLIDAIDKFDPDKNVKFETYASLRIRGTILDYIRKMDWIPRTVRQLGLSEEEYCNWQSQLKVTNVISLNEFEEQGAGPEPVMDASHNSHFARPEDVVEEAELKQMLIDSLELLTEKERRVIELYYYEELTLKELSPTDKNETQTGC